MRLRTIRQFVVFVVVPLALVIMAVTGLTVHLTNRISSSANQEELQRTKTVAQSLIMTSKMQLEELTTDNAFWDDAAENIYTVEIDETFVKATWGDVAVAGKPYEAVMIADRRANLLFAIKYTEPLEASGQSYFGAGLSKLIHQLPATSTEFGSTSALISTQDGPAIVAVANFVPSTKGVAAKMAEARYLVFLKYLTPENLKLLGERFVIPGLALTVDTPPLEAMQLTGVAGEVLGHLTWTSQKPGDTARRQVMPMAKSMLAALIAVLAGIALLCWFQFRTIAARERMAIQSARIDALTGLPNRTSVVETVEMALAKNETGRCLLFADLDGFKDVNDTYDHETGDTLIRAVAAGFKCLLNDMGVLGRIGGDEFVVFLNPNCTPNDAHHMAGRMIKFLAEPFDIDGKLACVGASIGLAIVDETVTSSSELMRRADVAMYAAKERGKNQLAVFDAEIDKARDESADIVNELREILNTRRLAVAYQPCYNATTLEITCVEALARWPMDSKRKVGPDKFIALAEQAGLIDEVGRQVIRQACADAKSWPDIKIAINVSPYQLRNVRFTFDLVDIVDSAGIARNRIELELTEGTLVEDTDWLSGVFDKIHELGFSLALDDFGAGYSSIAYLRKLQFERIKIDRSMTSSLADCELSRKFLQATALIAQGIHAQITAEGVEKQEDVSLLRLAGCNDLQGYLFSKPRPASEIAALLSEKSIERGAAA